MDEPQGQGRSKVMIVAEHVEFKPQMKGKDGDGKDDEAGAAAAEGNPEPAAEEQAPDEVELKEAASF